MTDTKYESYNSIGIIRIYKQAVELISHDHAIELWPYMRYTDFMEADIYYRHKWTV